jgi:hypothetical protein
MQSGHWPGTHCIVLAGGMKNVQSGIREALRVLTFSQSSGQRNGKNAKPILPLLRQEYGAMNASIRGTLENRLSTAFISSVILFEVKIGQIHVAIGQDADGENILPFVKTHIEELRGQIPVVPLTPGQRV